MEARPQGQALIEYILIMALVGIAFGVALAATGPAVGNVFSNTLFNLLGQTPEARDTQDPVDFWLTVTWVADNPVQEVALPTRTLPPFTLTPTFGPSPTPTLTPTVPTATPTFTPPPTATPEDFIFDPPWLDQVNDPRYWRVNSSTYVGSEDWVGTYFLGRDLDYNGATRVLGPVSNLTHYGSEARRNLLMPNANYIRYLNVNGSPFDGTAQDGTVDNWSARYTRSVYFPAVTRVRFYLSSYDDGVRVWLLAPGQSAATCFPGVVSGQAGTGDTAYNDPNTGCLILDDWNNQLQTGRSIIRTIPAGQYTIQVDHYEATGGSSLNLEFRAIDNVDDTRVDAAGAANPAGGVADCLWQPRSQSNANSLDFMWEDYAGGDLPALTRCHLELRGYVQLDEVPIPNPELVFWSVWDLQNTAYTGWLEIAEYVPDAAYPSERVLDRSQLVWQRVDLHAGSSRNYNWTRYVVDLTNVNGVDYSNKKVTLRFVMQNRTTSNNTRRWYIDDIEIRSRDAQDFGFNNEWTLNDPEHADDFLRTGQVSLTATRALPDIGNELTNPTGCCSWEFNANGTVNDFSEAYTNRDAGGWVAYEHHRYHVVELNGVVDTTAPLVDLDGDGGRPIISFFHAYNLGRHIGLEVQYSAVGLSDDPNTTIDESQTRTFSNWQTFPGGLLREISLDAVSTQLTLTQVDLPVPDGFPSRFRLRFAMIVHEETNNQTGGRGWWVDNIRLHREDPPRFLDYPFYDGAEDGLDNWGLATNFQRVALPDAREGAHAYTDTPEGDYSSADSNFILEMVYQIDLFNDTPENLAQDDRDPDGGNSHGMAAVRPVFSFWHRRSLNDEDDLLLEWRRNDGDPLAWTTLWAYSYRMNTNADPIRNLGEKTGQNYAWEYVRADLTPIVAQMTDAGSVYEDDIILRIRMATNRDTNVRDGVWIDDIRFEEYVEVSHQLWNATPDRTINGVNYGPGDTAEYTADGDEFDWWTRWIAGGDWVTTEDWTGDAAHGGLRAWHDSGYELQDYAPTRDQWDQPPKTRQISYSILEMAQIIDLRATYKNEEPTLYFWSRYHMGRDDDRISVQISTELNLGSVAATETAMRARCIDDNRSGGTGDDVSFPQCYEQEWGWGKWTNVNFNIRIDDTNHYTWQRYQVDLTQYAGDPDITGPGGGPGAPGQRIRIRFVVDTQDSTFDMRDGWYVDSVYIGPRRDRVIRDASLGAFLDLARNDDNWTFEGEWGLSAARFRGDGGGAAVLGSWRERFWSCDGTCRSRLVGNDAQDFDSLLDYEGNIPQLSGISSTAFALTPTSRIVTDINYDLFGGAPRPGVFNATDYFSGRWTLDTPFIGSASGVTPGTYTFFAVSNQGVRMKWQEINASGQVIPNAGAPLATPSNDTNDATEWNIIYNWNSHGRTPDQGVAIFEEGKRYRLTLDFWEGTADATIILNIGGSSFSFTDSPRQSAALGTVDVPPVLGGNSSMILDGVIDLRNTTYPTLSYWTVYELSSQARATVEVSINGGFDWTRTGLDTDFQEVLVEGTPKAGVTNPDPLDPDDWDVPPVLGPTRDMVSSEFSNTTVTDWQFRQNSLLNYRTLVMVRFRFNFLGGTQTSHTEKDTSGASAEWKVGWWVVDVRIGE